MNAETKKKLQVYVDSYMSHLDNLAYEFETDTKTLKANMSQFVKLHNFFEREIDAIYESEDKNGVVNALEKFDKIMMLTLRILELKVEIQQNLKEVKDRVQNLTGYRTKVENIVLNLASVENQFRIEEENDKKS